MSNTLNGGRLKDSITKRSLKKNDGESETDVSLEMEMNRRIITSPQIIDDVDISRHCDSSLTNDTTNNNILEIEEHGDEFLEIRIDSVATNSNILNRDQSEVHHILALENRTANLNNVKGFPASRKDEHLTSNLDHHERVERGSKVVSSCQSMASRVFSWRSMMLLLLHLSFVINTIPKNTTPIAIVCMVKPQAVEKSADGMANVTSGVTERVYGPLLEEVRGNVQVNTTREKAHVFEFDWDSNTVGLVLSSISFTSWVGSFFANLIRDYLGNKWTITLLTLGSALTTFLSPVAARMGPSVLVGLRVISGLALNGNMPIVADTMVWWTPESERLTSTTLAFSGFNMAGIITFFIAGFLCSVPMDNGWPFIFYIFGAITLLWTLAWHIMCSQKPEDHPWISDEEKTFILATRSLSTREKRTVSRDKPPYRAILTSVPIIVYFIVTSVHIWSLTIVYTYIPVYFSRLLGFTYEETGVLVSSVAFCRLFGAFIWTAIGNMLMSRSGMTTNKNRKIIFTAGSGAAGIFLVAVTFVDSDLRWLAASIMFVVMVAQSVYAVLMPALVLDMAPRYAGFISGITMSIAAVVSIPGPLMVAALTPTNSQTEWTTVWLVMAAAMVATAVIFLVFGKASPLPWADASQPFCSDESTRDRMIGSAAPDID